MIKSLFFSIIQFLVQIKGSFILADMFELFLWSPLKLLSSRLNDWVESEEWAKWQVPVRNEFYWQDQGPKLSSHTLFWGELIAPGGVVSAVATAMHVLQQKMMSALWPLLCYSCCLISLIENHNLGGKKIIGTVSSHHHMYVFTKPSARPSLNSVIRLNQPRRPVQLAFVHLE